ncbi:MAG: ABC transporter ATP-binding protein [Lachnospiraceae bacterium]|nr:ABC transporter ATP-binding protein [Lachnospiraceae bacterium]
MIEVKNLVKRYGDRNVVDNLSFTVGKGQIVGFLGPNGAGKSTTMNIITGYISATEGTVTVNGHDIYDEPEKAKESIGYLPEQPPLYPDMLVREYLNFVCDLKKVRKAEKEKTLSRVMRLTKITDVSERLIKNLSKGYKQRVGMAGAMIGDPEILILDEPTVGLDPKQILEMRDLIRELSKSHTIFMSSHIMQEVSAVCSEILIINEGRLVVSDKTEDITSHVERTHELSLLVKGNKDLIQSVIGKLEHVESCRVLKTSEQEIHRVEISSSVECDIRESLFYALAEAKCAILEMNRKEASLEEAFIHLTGEGTRQFGGKKKKGKKPEDGKEEKEDVRSL